MSTPRPFRMAAAVLLLGITSVAVVANTASASTSRPSTSRPSTTPPSAPGARPPAQLRPSPAASSAGIRRAGEAFMGWRRAAAGSARDRLAGGGYTRANTSAPAPAASSNFGVRTATTATSPVEGIDVSSHQGNVSWSYWHSAGKRFAYVKATEGTSYRNPYFSQQYLGSYYAGMIRGSYHFALPASSSGVAQADFFVAHGGSWSRDGKTLPGALDIEYNPYGATCYGLTQSAMVSWIGSFAKEYKRLTGRDAVIYSTTDWWTRCTGNTTAFHTTNPLWIARYSTTVGTLPGGWPYQTIWQYSASYGMDRDRFNGAFSRLQALALG